MKNIIFSHESDIDGLGCIILSKLAFEEVDYLLKPNVYKLEKTFRNYIETGNLSQYDKIYVTDLALHNPSLKMVAESSLKDKVLIFDHHKSAIDENLNIYDFTKIVEEDETGKRCGTDLFYEYLMNNNLIKTNRAIDEFVGLTKLEDTWQWKKVKNGEKAHDLAILLNAIGAENYIANMIAKLKANTNNFEMNEQEIALIKKKKEEYDDILKSIMKSAEYFVDENNNKFGIVYANYEYRNELAEYIKRKGNPENIKYFIAVAMDKGEFGQKAYRSIIEGFDVSEIAVQHGGGGHLSAAGVNITGQQKAKALKLPKREGLKYLANSSYPKNNEII